VKTQVEIDPNVRVRGQLTYARLGDVKGPLAVGQTVEVVEPESDLVGVGRVVEIDAVHSFVYLGVDWASFGPRIAAAETAPQEQGGEIYWRDPVDVRVVYSDGSVRIINSTFTEEAFAETVAQDFRRLVLVSTA